jgi:enoyl-[acyl-carrier protein] reductase/trans-2-enoyl-CoA reductase (NAD+)
MIITPNIRSNFFTNTHPLGCEKNIQSQIKEVKQYDKYIGPKNVLIIGGSSGYGLSSRISLAFGANANTVNVSFESEPRGKRTGSAGYWNNVYFLNEAKETNNIHKDFLGDAFSDETKQRVTKYIKDNLGTIDLVIYSLAAGARKNNETNEVVRSQIKTIGETVIGNTIDIASNKIVSLEIEPATEQEIEDTVFVMGGSDWRDWIHFLDQEKVLSPNVKTIAYTYIGGPTTASIYRNGTLGKAKEDLEKEANKLNKLLQNKYHGEALISSSKAVVSKASVFIPSMPIYVGCLFEVMKKHNVHETILQHKHRLFKDMVYGEKRIVDKLGRIRLDHYEMDELIQKETNELMNNTNENNFMDIN